MGVCEEGARPRSDGARAWLSSAEAEAEAGAEADAEAEAEAVLAEGATAADSPGRHSHSTPSSTVVDCPSLGVDTLILLPLLSFSVEMAVSPLATMRLDLSGPLLESLPCKR